MNNSFQGLGWELVIKLRNYKTTEDTFHYVKIKSMKVNKENESVHYDSSL